MNFGGDGITQQFSGILNSRIAYTESLLQKQRLTLVGIWKLLKHNHPLQPDWESFLDISNLRSIMKNLRQKMTLT